MNDKGIEFVSVKIKVGSLKLFSSLKSIEVDYLSTFIVPTGKVKKNPQYFQIDSGNLHFIMCVRQDNDGKRLATVFAPPELVKKVNAYFDLVGYGMPEVTDG